MWRRWRLSLGRVGGQVMRGLVRYRLWPDEWGAVRMQAMQWSAIARHSSRMQAMVGHSGGISIGSVTSQTGSVARRQMYARAEGVRRSGKQSPPAPDNDID